MNATRLTLSLALSLLGLASAAPARADHGIHVEQFARQLQDETGQLSAEIRAHYRGVGCFGHLLADAQQLYGLAAHVRSAARGGASPGHLAADVRRMERLVENIEDHLSDVDHRVHSHHGGYGRGHAPCDTRCARRLLRSIDRTLVNLEDAIDDLARFSPRPVRPLPHDDYSHQPDWRRAPASSGISVGGRGFSIQIGR